ncbi:MAG: CRISPR-associated endonuclease Cas1 [Roseburia faecis]
MTENRFQVKYKDGMVKSIPAETLEVIEIFGKIQITTQCITECLKRGVNILFYSTKGAYFGRLISTNHVNVQRQRLQAAVTEDEQFKLDFSKRIINAKIRNQIVILRRYARNQEADIQRAVIEMQNMYQKLDMAQSIEQVMGFEGTAAKIYFGELGKLIDPAFAFTGRNRRPPRDPFNSLISLGYSIILNELYGEN